VRVVPLLLLVTATAIAVVAAAPSPAAANPRTLPFTYGTATQSTGDLEIEQFVDMIGVRLERELPDGSAESTVVPRFQLQTELELGITDCLEYGLYLAFRQGATVDTPALRFQGLKNRLRWRVTAPGRALQVALYGEVATFHDEIEVEEKLILEYRAGRMRAMANLWIEQEWYFVADETKLVYNPTLGATYEITPAITVGAEYWLRGRFDDASGDTATSSDTPAGVRHYGGPTVMAQRGNHWLAAGVYTRLDGLGQATALDDPYGRVWVRVIAGIGL
jgi:hypothetical protein